MKRTYLARRNAFLSPQSFSWGVGALVFVIFVFLFRFFMPNLFWKAFSPAFHLSDTVVAGTHAFLDSFGNTALLVEQNERLVSENVALANENQALLQKNSSLSALLGAPTTQNPPGVLAGIVARPPESPYDTLVLAAGEGSGVVLGMEAFGEGGVPIGIITSVTTNFSRATLFSSSGMSIGGWVGRAHVPLTILGTGGGTMVASVARSAAVTVGDVVFAPGPGMLPIGSVVRVDSDPLSPAVTLRIMPATNLFSLAWIELRTTGVSSSAIATSTSL